MVQWLGLGSSTAGRPGLVPGWGTKVLQAETHSRKKKEKYNPNMTMKKYHKSPNWHLNYKITGQYASFEVTKYKNRLRNSSKLRRPRDIIIRCNTWSGIGLWTTERSFMRKLSNFGARLGLNLLKHVHYHSFKYRLQLLLPSGRDE